MNDEALYNEVRDASKNIKEITRKINDGEGTLGKLVNDDKLYRDTTATLKKAEKAMDGLGDTGPIQVLGSVIGTCFREMRGVEKQNENGAVKAPFFIWGEL